MYAIKGAWVGQTFALAASNDSGGKKSRIRRSKAERKTMVETFINNYQKLNNGNFPSLTLTHKEVGGSFYTVREIVREIIQENKVLGPAKLSKNYTSLEQFPLGSIAIEPQTCLSPSEEIDIASPVTLNQFHTETQEDILNSNGQLNGSEHQSLLLDNEQVVNNSNVTIEEVSDFEGPVWTQSISDDQVTNAEQHLRTPEPFNIPNYQEVNNEESDAPGLDSAMPITQQEVSLEHHAETNKELHMHSEQEYAGNGYLTSGDEEGSQALGKPNECGESIYRREVAEDNLDSAVVQTNDPKLSNGSGESIYRREVAEDNLDSAVVQTNDPEFSNGSGESIYRREVTEDNLDSAVVQTNDPKLSNGSGESIYRREVTEDNLDSAVVQTNDPILSNGSGESIYRREVTEDNLDSAVVQTNDPKLSNGSGESIYRREVAEDNLDSAIVQTNDPKLSNGSGESIYRREVAEDNLGSAVVQTNDPKLSHGSGESIYRREVAEDNLDSAVVQTNDPKLSNGKTGLTTDVLVEKFPLRPVSRTIHDFEVAIREQCDKPKTSAATETDCDITSSSNSLNVEDVAVLSVGDSPPESLKSISKETLVAQTSPLVGEKPVNDTERMSIGKKINTRNSGVAYGQQRPIRVGNNAGKSQLRNQHESSKKTGTSSTLNRPNLEMWEGGSSVKPAGRESNPLFALLKEFIKAIEKFFTE